MSFDQTVSREKDDLSLIFIDFDVPALKP